MKPTKYDIADSNIAGLGTDLEKQVKLKAAQTEAAWKNVGSQVGTQVWRIENFCVVAVNPKDYGMFYEGDSYIILNVSNFLIPRLLRNQTNQNFTTLLISGWVPKRLKMKLGKRLLIAGQLPTRP